MVSPKQCSDNKTDLLETDEERAFQGTGVLIHQLQTPNFPGGVLTIPGLSPLQRWNGLEGQRIEFFVYISQNLYRPYLGCLYMDTKSQSFLAS